VLYFIQPRAAFLHGFKAVDTLLGIALADLFQRLVLVTALRLVLGVDDIILSGTSGQFSGR